MICSPNAHNQIKISDNYLLCSFVFCTPISNMWTSHLEIEQYLHSTQNVKQTVKRLQKHLHLTTFLIYFFSRSHRLLLFVTYDRFVWFCFVFFFLFLFASFLLVHSFCQPYTQCTICKWLGFVLKELNVVRVCVRQYSNVLFDNNEYTRSIVVVSKTTSYEMWMSPELSLKLILKFQKTKKPKTINGTKKIKTTITVTTTMNTIDLRCWIG